MRSEGYCSRPVCVCVCVCVFPRPSSATRATKQQTRHTGDLSIVFASVQIWPFSYNRFLAKLEFSCYSLRYKSAILYTLRGRLYSAHARSGGAPLLTELREKSLGISINGLFLGAFAHADDFRTMASNMEDATEQASVVYSFTKSRGSAWRNVLSFPQVIASPLSV